MLKALSRVAADASAGLTTLRAAVGFRPVYTPFARKPVTVLDPGSTFGAVIVVIAVQSHMVAERFLTSLERCRGKEGRIFCHFV